MRRILRRAVGLCIDCRQPAFRAALFGIDGAQCARCKSLEYRHMHADQKPDEKPKTAPRRTVSPRGLQENGQIAERLRGYADLLEDQGEDGFRVRAYRRAADQISLMERSLRAIYREGGLNALIALPAIGRGIAAAVAELLTTGRWAQYDRLRGETTPEALFRTLPGVGEVLAERFATIFDAETLEDLETSLRNPRMKLPGLGLRRRRALLSALSERLGAIRRERGGAADVEEPPVSLLLEADALYRQKAAAGELRRIAPRRFNPGREAWLPIMHARRNDWHLTVLFSNTARAHELDRTNDWVVIFFHRGDGPEAQRTIVTQRQGALAGRRVVRGREDDCAAHYADQGPRESEAG